MYALGWTQHSKGAQNIRGMAMLQLLLGNIGVRGGGMNALRGHSNIQGLTDIGLMSNLIPGYLTLPTEKEVNFDDLYVHARLQAAAPRPDELWQNYKKFMASFLKSMWGNAATPRHFRLPDACRSSMPGYDCCATFESDVPGEGERLFLPGLQPALSLPNRGKVTASLSKLKFLVVMDPLQTETSRFWKDQGVSQRRQARGHPDRSVRAAGNLLRGG